MTTGKRNRAYIVGKALFWLGAGVAMSVYIGIKGIETYRIMRGGSQAPGKVISVFDDEREDGNRVGIVTVAEYEFFEGGARFTGRTEDSQGSWSEGDTLTIEFNPRNPTENRAAGDRDVLGKYWLLVVFGGTFAYLGIRLNVETLIELYRAGKGDAIRAQHL